MTRIAVIGGTGYAGSSIVQESARRGHEVVALSRSAPEEPIEGVRYIQGDAAEAAASLAKDADVVVAALAPRGDMEEKLVAVYSDLAPAAAAADARLIVIGGFSSLRPKAGADRFADGGEFPEDWMPEIRAMEAVRKALAASPAELDWLFVSPAMVYGADAPGEARGTYRVSDEIALLDESGQSEISGADFALAVVDEIENPGRRSGHIGVAH